MRLRIAGALLALTVCCPLARAQTVTWLTPEHFTTRAGSDCPIRWEAVDEHGRVDGLWSASEISWFFLRNAGAQQNFGDVEFEAQAFETDHVAHLTVTGPGVAMLGIDRAERSESLSAEELSAFLAARVAPDSTPTLAQQSIEGVRIDVRRIESAKLLLGVIDSSGRVRPSPIAGSKAGLHCEIRPLLDPTRGPFGGDLPLRVYLPGGSAGVRVRATHVASGRVHECTTDAEGLGHFRLSAAGVWRVEAHRAGILVDGEGTAGTAQVWEIQSATLTFEVPGARGGGDRRGAGQSDRDLKGND